MATLTWDYWTSHDSSASTTCSSSVWTTWTGATYSYIWTEWTTARSGTSSSTNYCTTSNDITWYTWTQKQSNWTDRVEEVFPRVQEATKRDRARERQLLNQTAIRNWFYEEQKKEQEEARKLAEDKAQILLEELIGKEEMAIYKETGRILVKGRHDHDFIVRKDATTIILPKNKVVSLRGSIKARSSCIILKEHTPPTDKVIGLKLALENDEKATLKVGNEQGERDFTPQELRAACGGH